MSRFFRGSSDSESESDYESSVVSSSESEESEEEIQEQKTQKPAGAMRFMKGAQGDSSESESEVETGTRVVKSAKDKVYDDMRGIVRSMKNSKKINDWAAVMNEFDRLQKVVTKSTAMFVNEGGIPRFYVRTLIQLDEQVRESLANKDALKKMKATTAKALTALKQKIRKIIQQHADQIEKFKQNPVSEEESADERTKAMDSDDMFDEDSESEEEGATGRSKWTKSESKKAETPKQVTFEEPEDDDGFVVVGKGGKPLEISQENVFKALADLNEVRGKKGTDKSTLTHSLRKVLSLAKNPYQQARVLLALIPALFDTVASSSSMTPSLWKEIADDFNALMDILEENETIIVSANASEIEEDLEHEQLYKNGESVYILGNIGSYIEKLDQEFLRSLQNIDAHTTDYLDRLKDETELYTLIIRTHKYFTRISDEDSKTLIIMCRIEHLYYKNKAAINILEETVKKARPDLADLLLAAEPVESLCKELYSCSHDRTRTRTLLCHVYHIALQNDFQQAKDMILMSHIQENIHQADIETQILYNRTIVQVGLCAFRCGFLKEAVYTLMDISSSGKAKELLGQGYSQRHSEKTPEQEKLEKQRQLPAHMHINLEVLECVFLTCSMLLEIPNLAQNAHDVKRKVISKPFRKMMEYNDRQLLTAPPENLRDHVMAASRYMASGEWQKAADILLSLDIWSSFANDEEIKAMLKKSIQEESLRTYIFSFLPFYSKLSLQKLSDMFGLSVDAVKVVCCRMILSDDIAMKLNQESTYLVVDTEAALSSRLGYLLENYATKMNVLVENNEKMLEVRSAMPSSTTERKLKGIRN